MLYEISCNIGSRYNGIPLYIYLTYTLCKMAVILQTRCFQMDNCEPDLSFSKNVELYLWFSFQVCSTQAVYSFTKWTAWGLAPNEDNRTPGTGRLKRLEHCELMNTYRSWWRHTSQNVDLQELQILLKEGGGGGGGFKLILAIYTLSIFCEIPFRWIQHLTGH